MKIGYNKDLLTQVELMKEILVQNEPLKAVLTRISELNDDTMYVASGSISQTIWNYQEGRPLMEGISDFDVVYFDEDLSYDAEDVIIKKILAVNSDISIPIDIKNQARVHLWIKEKWGREMERPYTSSEDAISSWSSTASCIGVQMKNNEIQIYAPYGLNDIFGQIMRPNRERVFRELYDLKVEKWTKKWNFLNVIDW